MIKNLLLLILSVLFLQDAKAQKRDTTLLYMSKYRAILSDTTGADYMLLIISPPDSSTGVKIYSVKEYYMNNKLKLIGTAIVNTNDNNVGLGFVGPCMEFFKNGHKKSLTNYDNTGMLRGYEKYYYPNGKIYANEQINEKGQQLLIDCNDSTGKVLAENGNGEWIKFDDDFQNKKEEGQIVNGLEEGEWREFINDTAKYVNKYHIGQIISSDNPYGGQIFEDSNPPPQFKGGMSEFFEFFRNNLIYPTQAEKENIFQGDVDVNFVVEKDGSLTNFKTISCLNQSLADEAIRVIKISAPWLPGTINGELVRVRHTLALTIKLEDSWGVGNIQRDSIIVYIRNTHEITENKAVADYILVIKTLSKSNAYIEVNPIHEYYMDGRDKLIGTAKVYIKDNMVFLGFNGPVIEFYQNKKRKFITNYKNMMPFGNINEYYPNGQLYAITKYDKTYQKKLIECHDSTGKVIATNGNGSWIKFDHDLKMEIEEGQIVNGLEQGEWHLMVNGVAKYINIYDKGNLLSSTDPYGGQVFSAVEHEPEFPGGIDAFYKFIEKTINYSAYDIIHNIQGKVIVQFIVEKDGSLTNIKAITGPDEKLENEAIRVISLSAKWQPGMQNNKPVRVQYTLPVSFNLGPQLPTY